MSSYNRVILMGNLTRDPELREAGTVTVCDFGIATNRQYTDKSGEKKQETAFIDVSAFGKQAEVISQHLSKGDPILLEGRLRSDRWETREGDRRQKLCVTLERFVFVGGRRNQEGSQNHGTDTPSPPF